MLGNAAGTGSFSEGLCGPSEARGCPCGQQLSFLEGTARFWLSNKCMLRMVAACRLAYMRVEL